MFVQVFQGQVSDAQTARAALDRWIAELAPGATGWLGSTGGVTEDGTLIAAGPASSPRRRPEPTAIGPSKVSGGPRCPRHSPAT